VAITYNGAGTVSLYVDQVLVRAATSFTHVSGIAYSPISYQTSGDVNSLGGPVTNTYYIGSLRNIFFYDYALSATAVALNFVAVTER